MTLVDDKTLRITHADFDQGVEESDGFCRACGEVNHGGCESDAHEYICEHCSEPSVYGFEELAIAEGLEFIDD